MLDAAQTAASRAGITDQQVEAHRWQAELDATTHALHDQQARLHHYEEQVRIAECHVLAYALPGAAGEIAKVLHEGRVDPQSPGARGSRPRLHRLMALFTITVMVFVLALIVRTKEDRRALERHKERLASAGLPGEAGAHLWSWEDRADGRQDRRCLDAGCNLRLTTERLTDAVESPGRRWGTAPRPRQRQPAESFTHQLHKVRVAQPVVLPELQRADDGK